MDDVASRVAEAKEANIQDGDAPDFAKKHVGRFVHDDAREGEQGNQKAGNDDHGLASSRPCGKRRWYSSRLMISRVLSRWRIRWAYSRKFGSPGGACCPARSR